MLSIAIEIGQSLEGDGESWQKMRKRKTEDGRNSVSLEMVTDLWSS